MHRILFKLAARQPSVFQTWCDSPGIVLKYRHVTPMTNPSAFASDSSKQSSSGKKEKEPARTAGQNPNEDNKVLKDGNPLSATNKPKESVPANKSSQTTSKETSPGSNMSKDSSGSMPSKPGTPSQPKAPTYNISSSGPKGQSPSSGRPKDGKIKMDDYKVQEYFQHNPYSYYDVETVMVPSRLPQPSSQQQEQAK